MSKNTKATSDQAMSSSPDIAASAGFAPMCNENKLQALMTELCAQQEKQTSTDSTDSTDALVPGSSSSYFPQCPKSSGIARTTRTNSSHALRKSSSLSSFSSALASIPSDRETCDSSDFSDSSLEFMSDSSNVSNTKTKPKRKKMKKQVRFSECSTLALFHPRVDTRELYWNRAEKAKFKRDTMIVACHIRATLPKPSGASVAWVASHAVSSATYNATPNATPNPTPEASRTHDTTSNPSSSQSKVTKVIKVMPEVLPLLLALEKGTSIAPEELIGIEDLIQGLDHVRSMDAQRLKINRIIVRTWRHLKRRGLASGDEDNQDDQDDQEILQKVSCLYRAMTRKSLLKARCHAAYVHGMNRGVESSGLERGQDGLDGLRRGRTLCRRAALAA